MNKRRLYSVASTVSLCLASLLTGPLTRQGAIAQTPVLSSPVALSQASAVPIGFVPPADNRAPRYTRPGGVRSSCDAVSILPESGTGLTTAARPMLQAYFKSEVQKVWLVVESVDGSEYYTFGEDDYLEIPAGGGLVEVPLPKTLVELTPDKPYIWSMVLICGDPLGPNTPVINGGVQRVSSTLSADEDATLSLMEKAAVYGESGIWYDLVSTLTLIRQEQPENLQAERNWETVLRSVGLGIVLNSPES